MAAHQASERSTAQRAVPSGNGASWDERGHLVLLAAEPDPEALGALNDLTSLHTVELVRCYDGAQALLLAGKLAPDLMVLSAHLPIIDADVVVEVVRGHLDVPIFVGIRAGEAEAARPGLAAGATGVLTRPYEHWEVDGVLKAALARVKARIEKEAVIHLGSLTLNSPAFEVRCADQPVELTLREFEILRFLMLHAERAVTQDQIRSEVWGSRGDSPSSNAIAVHIKRLRARLRGAAEINTIRGVGYRFTISNSTS